EIDDESEEETPREGGKRGPKTQTRAHFRLPIATKEKGEKRWVFQCRHAGCKTRLGFRRTVGSDKMFADESPAPKLGNLATHVKQFHFGVPPPADAPGQTRNPSASAARLMGDWLEEGKLNPIINTTQSNFLKVFAAWIIEDDLAFTTGETDGIQRLFTFMQTRYLLPSDTTVRNTLSKMYIDMYNLVKSELAAIDSWVLEREELRPLFLKNSEWELLEALDNTLKPFTRVTLQMSRSRTPTLPWVLPMYEYMRKHLRNSKDDTSLPTAIRDATEAASEKLEEYYSKACGCQLNTIATRTCV
ncbi:hypothetical protein C8F04DRAFT_976168, partial [Mycena alexandri]